MSSLSSTSSSASSSWVELERLSSTSVARGAGAAAGGAGRRRGGTRAVGKVNTLPGCGAVRGLGLDPGGDDRDADLAFHIVVERRAPDDVGVGVDQFLDVAGGLVDLHQAHVLAAGDRDDDALGALHR